MLHGEKCGRNLAQNKRDLSSQNNLDLTLRARSHCAKDWSLAWQKLAFNHFKFNSQFSLILKIPNI